MSEVDLIESKNYAPKNLGQVCVLGLGKTGSVVANYLCSLLGKRVESVHIYAGEKKEFAMKTADKLLSLGATVSFDDKEINFNYDLCIASPGFSNLSDIFKSAEKNCNEVISEVEFAWRESRSDATWVAITGTNGKTTTTALTEYILQNSSKHAVAVGNIGNVALEAVAADEWKSKYEQIDIYVLEASSYQLALCSKFAPKISVLLNISPDHLDWHGSFEAYVKAKLSVFNNAQIGVINIDDPKTNEYIGDIKNKNLNQIIKNTKDENNIIVEYMGKSHCFCAIGDMKIIGEHNCVNARAAASICMLLGLNDDQISEQLKSFRPLEHRLEPCGIVAGVRLYNDSKATNVDSVLVAIDSFAKNKAIFMLGGKDKNTNLDELVNKCLDNLKGVILYGEAQDRFYDAFKSAIDKNDKSDFLCEKSQNMKTAFKLAMEKAYPGDFVVLSPACSSFDEFDNFEQRGEVFKALVEKCK